MWKLLLALLLLPSLALGIGVRLDDIGQGAAPGLMLLADVPLTDNLQIGAGFGSVQAEGITYYHPRGDMTARSGPVFGRIGAWFSPDREWFPYYGGGFSYSISHNDDGSEPFGVEFFYVFGFDKAPEQLEYIETQEGKLVLNLWANF